MLDYSALLLSKKLKKLKKQNMLTSWLMLVVFWILYLHILWILTNRSGSPISRSILGCPVCGVALF